MAQEEQNPWRWWYGFEEEVEHEGHYRSADFATREEAIEAARKELPDIDGNTHFHIVEAVMGEQEFEGDDHVPFSATRNKEVIDAS